MQETQIPGNPKSGKPNVWETQNLGTQKPETENLGSSKSEKP